MSAELSSLTPLANHLWQSTIFVGVICLLTLAFKKNRAAVRYWLWFAASVKFLLPFSFLVALGSRLSWRSGAPIAQPQWSFVVDNAIQPFAASTAPTQVVSPHASFPLASILLAVWLCGIVVGIAFWLKCWMQMRRIRRNAIPLPLGLPIPALSSPSQIEPGVFGIFCPVLLLPEGIESRLTPAQLDAIVAHEMAHVRRRDNLTAAIHMLVEIVFWFFPVVWWLRARLIGERENACDEAVISMGSEPESYAEGIIEVCKSYAGSAAVCIAGISGSDLKKRVIRIVNRRLGENLTRAKKATLALASIAAVVTPLIMGFVNAPLLHGQSPEAADWEKAAGGKMAFEVASVKQNQSGSALSSMNIPLLGDVYHPDGGLFSGVNVPLVSYIYFAYKLTGNEFQILLPQLPKWVLSERFDIEARAPEGEPTKDQMRIMMQSLLADRFKLVSHYESRQIPLYALMLVNPGRTGPQLRPHSNSTPCSTVPPDASSAVALADGFPRVCGGIVGMPTEAGRLRIGARNVSIEALATSLAQMANLDRAVVDRTGVTGNFDLVFEWPAQSRLPNVDSEAEANRPTFLEALHDQLGLKLESTTGPLDVFVIDHIEEPTPN